MADRVWEEAEQGFEAVLWGLRQLTGALHELGSSENSRALSRAAGQLQSDIIPLFVGVYNEAQAEREEE